MIDHGLFFEFDEFTKHKGSYKTYMRMSLLILILLIGACSLKSDEHFVTAIVDSAMYITGKVIDRSGTPLIGADVSIGFMETKTDEDGCFEFDGDHPEFPIDIRISKAGFTTIRESKQYSGYFIVATVARANSSEIGQLVWTELDLSNPNVYVSCEGENLERFRVTN